MTSEAQLAANRSNAAKSTGPTTEAGKNTARFNARRHGLTGQFYCMSEGDEQAYRVFEANLLTDLKPVGHYESQLAISIIQDHWRLNRSKGTECNVFAQWHDRYAPETDAPSASTQVAATMASTSQSKDRYFSNLALYEARIHRMMTRNENRLKELQAERKAAEAEARREAELLVRLALLHKETLDPKEPIEANGFVFTTSQVLGIVNRKDRLNEAEFYEKRSWSRAQPWPKAA